jgi:NAD-dependent SIR2 family protein deacetylase
MIRVKYVIGTFVIIMNNYTDENLQEAAYLIKNADAIAIFAGAGMGVDSGLEQYRGADGLWTKSITLNNTAINYNDLMKPVAFREEPELAWGLIGFLMDKYDNTQPHVGFSILKEWVQNKEYFIVTSNIDEHFQKAGFNKNRIFEYHGSIYKSQCMYNLECGVWDAEYPKVDAERSIASPPFPMCPVCNSCCRPNVYLFEDGFFVPILSGEQQFRYMEWEEKVKKNCRNIVAMEIGAGKTISTIRRTAEKFAGDESPLIRINLNDFETDKTSQISIPLGAKESLLRIKDFMDRGDCPF